MSLAALMHEAAAAYDAGDFERAEPLFLQIVGHNPRDAEAWHVLAIMAVRSGRAAEAIERAMQAHRLDRGNHLYLNTLGVAQAEAQKMGQALSAFERARKERPTHAETHYNLGKAYEKLGRLPEAERSYLRARALEPQKGDAAHNLAVLYARQGSFEKALPLYEEARRRLPDDEGVAVHIATAALATAGPDAAIAELGSFIARHPHAAAVHAELARRLLAEGRLEEGWQEYAWRRGAAGAAVSLEGRRVLLKPDQGLGDHLFFLRFAARLRRVASHVAFACPEKLQPLLDGSGEPEGPFDLTVPLGDLPRLLRDSSTPPPLALSATHIEGCRARLAQLGPAPYLGVTWRGGTKVQAEFGQRGESPLSKEIDVPTLAAALRGWRGTVLVLQRLPLRDEIHAFAKALGKQVHDLGALNEDLRAMAALLAVIDEYVGVSNANMHIRAGVQKAARVLVPFPPEFRWMHAGDESPWFPGFRVYRQTSAKDWSPGLARLRDDLTV